MSEASFVDVDVAAQESGAESVDLPPPTKKAKKSSKKAPVMTTHAPGINHEVLERLESTREFAELRWGNTPYADIVCGIRNSSDRLHDH